MAGGVLDRPTVAVLVESEVLAALRRLNTVISAQPGWVDEVLPRIRASVLTVDDDGLMEPSLPA
jgi:hypothetical protein